MTRIVERILNRSILPLGYHSAREFLVESLEKHKKGSPIQAALDGPGEGMMRGGRLHGSAAVNRSGRPTGGQWAAVGLCPGAGLCAGAAGFFFASWISPSCSTI